MKQTVDWHSHWKSDKPGFHEGRVNDYLKQYLSLFELQTGDTVFIPLCGKAVDILWLARQGFNVIGVELSKVAVESFFEESSLEYERQQIGEFSIYTAKNITLYQGDYMQLQANQLVNCKLVYDRASIVAIESFNRAAYVAKMLELIPNATPMLIVLLEYDQTQMKGPPFSVPAREVIELYQAQYRVERLQSEELIEIQAHWKQRGLTSLTETALSLTVG